MEISSRTPEGRFNVCPICSKSLRIEPSFPSCDAPCPHCGHLLWFSPLSDIVAPISTFDDRSLDLAAVSLPESFEIPDYVVHLIPASVARERRVLPLSESANALVVAISYPLDQEAVEMLRFILNRRVLAVVVRKDWLDQQIHRYYPTN